MNIERIEHKEGAEQVRASLRYDEEAEIMN